MKRDVGDVDILVNNAGIVTGKKFLDCPDHMIQKTFEVNTIAHFWVSSLSIECDLQHKLHIQKIPISSYPAYKLIKLNVEEMFTLILHSNNFKIKINPSLNFNTYEYYNTLLAVMNTCVFILSIIFYPWTGTNSTLFSIICIKILIYSKYKNSH